MAAQLQVWSCPPTVLPAGGRVLPPSCPTVAGTLALLVASCSRGAGPLAGPWHLCIPDSSEDPPPNTGSCMGTIWVLPRINLGPTCLFRGLGESGWGVPSPGTPHSPLRHTWSACSSPTGWSSQSLWGPQTCHSFGVCLPGCIFRGESWWGLSSYLEVSRLCSPRTTSSGPVGPA